MRTWARTTTTVLAATALVGLLGVGASSANSASNGAEVASAAAIAAAPPPASRQPTSDTYYRSVTPCRIVDTRYGTGINGTKLSHLQQRTYWVGGVSNFPQQGGKNGGCGIPAGATAVAVSLKAINQQDPGYLRAWANGTGEPTATALTYNNEPIGSGVTLTINEDSNLGLRVRNYYGPTDLTIDVFGYYVKPIQALISPTGSPYSGSSRVLAGTRPATGDFRLTFDRDVRYCSLTANVYQSGYYASTDTYYGSTTQARVRLFNATGTPVNQYFYVEVVC